MRTILANVMLVISLSCLGGGTEGLYRDSKEIERSMTMRGAMITRYHLGCDSMIKIKRYFSVFSNVQKKKIPTGYKIQYAINEFWVKSTLVDLENVTSETCYYYPRALMARCYDRMRYNDVGRTVMPLNMFVLIASAKPDSKPATIAHAFINQLISTLEQHPK